MITNGFRSRPLAIGALIQFLSRRKWIFTLAAAALVTVAATAPPPVSDENTDEEYIKIMNLMDRADALRATGKPDAAKAKDQEAYKALIYFKRAHPKWNSTTVEYRLSELTTEIEGKPAESEAPTKTKAHTNLEAPAKHTSAPYKTTIKLLDPGTEPRKVLRLHPKASDKQGILLTVKLSVDMPAMAGAAGAPNLPAITIPVDISIDSVAPNGDITFKGVLGEGSIGTDGNLPPPAVDQAKKAFASAKGLALTMIMSSSGVGRVVNVEAPQGAPANMEQTIAAIKQAVSAVHTSTPIITLPEEAVGSGAKWESKTLFTTNGMDMAQTATFQLTSAEGDHISISKTADFTVKGSPQKIQQSSTPAMMPFGSMDLKGTLKGTSALDLSKVIPMQSTGDLELAMNMGIKSPKGNQPMSVKMHINFSLEAH